MRPLYRYQKYRAVNGKRFHMKKMNEYCVTIYLPLIKYSRQKRK